LALRAAPSSSLEAVISTGRRIRRAARRARRAGRKVGRHGRRRLLRLYYRAQLRRPIEPELAVFASYWYRGYSCNPRAIYEKLREDAPRVRGVWVVEKEHADSMPAGVDYVVAWTRAYYRLIARARYFVNNVNFPNDFVKREGTIHVQTHHGTPLKTMGLDLREAYFAGGRMNFDRLLRRVRRWDYSVSSNAFSTEIWKRVYPEEYETLEVGYPRNDVLVNATPADVERIRGELGIESEKRAVLFAPTHREYLGEYVPTVDLPRLAAALGPDYVILARMHYFYRDRLPAGEREAGGTILDVTRHPSIEELCLAADVLLTDYSSIMFDYAVLDRPIVIHAPDWDTYRVKRGTYFDLLAEPPGVVTTSDEELAAAFGSGAVWGEDATRLRAAFRSRFAALDDGRASERVVRAVWHVGVGCPPARQPRADDSRTRVEA
jgi:CDP-glycerol glycerophosphotransferase